VLFYSNFIKMQIILYKKHRQIEKSIGLWDILCDLNACLFTSSDEIIHKQKCPWNLIKNKYCAIMVIDDQIYTKI